MPRSGAPTADHPGRGARSTPAPHRVPEQTHRSSRHSESTPAAHRERRTTPPAQQQPAHHGLTLPRITAPGSFNINPDKTRNAQLALDMLNHGVIKSSDFDTSKPTPIALGEALAAAITPHDNVNLHLTSHLQREEGELRLFLIPDLDRSNFLNAHSLISSLDQLHTNLAPSIMNLIRGAHTLFPCFTAADAYEAIVELHWCGDETAEEALEMYRDQYAHEHNIPWQEVTTEQLREYAHAQQNFLMPEHIAERLPSRYHQPQAEPTQLLEQLGLFPEALGDIHKLISACKEAQAHGNATLHHKLSDWKNEYIHEYTAPWYAYMLGITKPNEDPNAPQNEYEDIVFEMLCEYDSYTMQNSLEPGPSASYLIPETPEGMQQLAGLTRKLKRQVELESRIYDTLKALVEPSPAPVREKGNTP